MQQEIALLRVDCPCATMPAATSHFHSTTAAVTRRDLQRSLHRNRRCGNSSPQTADAAGDAQQGGEERWLRKSNNSEVAKSDAMGEWGTVSANEPHRMETHAQGSERSLAR